MYFGGIIFRSKHISNLRFWVFFARNPLSQAIKNTTVFYDVKFPHCWFPKIEHFPSYSFLPFPPLSFCFLVVLVRTVTPPPQHKTSCDCASNSGRGQGGVALHDWTLAGSSRRGGEVWKVLAADWVTPCVRLGLVWWMEGSENGKLCSHRAGLNFSPMVPLSWLPRGFVFW